MPAFAGMTDLGCFAGANYMRIPAIPLEIPITARLNSQKSTIRHPVEGRDWAWFGVISPTPSFDGVTVCCFV
jgi:hypothetical protein